MPSTGSMAMSALKIGAWAPEPLAALRAAAPPPCSPRRSPPRHRCRHRQAQPAWPRARPGRHPAVTAADPVEGREGGALGHAAKRVDELRICRTCGAWRLHNGNPGQVAAGMRLHHYTLWFETDLPFKGLGDNCLSISDSTGGPAADQAHRARASPSTLMETRTAMSISPGTTVTHQAPANIRS